MSDNNLKFNLIDNVSDTLNQITNNIKNTTKFINELNRSLGNLQFNVSNVGAFKIGIKQVIENITIINQSLKDSQSIFSDYVSKYADWVTILASSHDAWLNLGEVYNTLN